MVFSQTLAEIVDENFVYARALHYLGISFFENQDKSLREVCKERGLDHDQVIKSFYEFDGCHRLSFKELNTYPIDLLLEYLKYAHHVFIKDKLPFITHVAKNCSVPEFHQLLPEFIEDFIYHIYEEEDTIFKYVRVLSDVSRKRISNPAAQLLAFQKLSLSDEFDSHEGSDEMKAIRSLVESVEPGDLREKVLIQEVKALDREMIYHAEIENKIMFPKALDLEKEVSALLHKISLSN